MEEDKKKEKDSLEFLSKQYGVPVVDMDKLTIPEEAIRLVPREIAIQHIVIPIEITPSLQSLTIAVANPSNIDAIDDIKFLTGYKHIYVRLASGKAIGEAIVKYYGDIKTEIGFDEEIGFKDDDVIRGKELGREADDMPIVRLVNTILTDAIKRGASDIHFEPYEKDFRVRYRIDGMLYEMLKPPRRLKNAIISRLKIMSMLDIAEKRLPQEGRIRLVMGKDKEVDFRVSILPTLWGESAALRLTEKGALSFDLSLLGFESEQLRLFTEAIHEPWGLILVVGPVDSGKTTTLYTALKELNKTTDKIVTIEDPVEISLPGIIQTQVKEALGLDYASLLKACLKQDPDIIMLDAIPNFETAELAVKAALTGHLILASLLTLDTSSSINHLMNMGIEPFLVTACLGLVCSQRSVRKICSECKEAYPVPPHLFSPHFLREIGFSEEEAGKEFYRGRGCQACNNTGYKGRTAIFEVLPVTDEFKECILQGYSSVELKREAMRLGMKTLRQAGLQKVKDGLTTIEEVLRTTRAD